MARPKKIQVILASSKDESEWIATAKDGSGLVARHLYPNHALNLLGDALRKKHGPDVEMEYELQVPASLEVKKKALLEKEAILQKLTHEIPAARYDFATACRTRHIKQEDIAALMGLSQGYVATLIKRGASTETVLSPRRRTPTQT